MRLSVTFSGLGTLVRKMGAEPVEWRSRAGELDELDIVEVLRTGLEIALEDVDCTDERLLTYKGQQVLLYIKDTRRDRHTLLEDVERGPRFHVAECNTLETMRAAGRLNRYVVTNNVTGEFSVEYLEQGSWGRDTRGEVTARLKVCRHCLECLDYEGYGGVSRPAKLQIWGRFSLREFFEQYETRFRSRPKHTDRTAPPGGYSEDWAAVSKAYRASAGWCCEQCGVDLGGPGRGKLLHVHHVDGVQGNNALSNLRALCLLCHGEQPRHGGMGLSTRDAATIEQLRREQGKSSRPARTTPSTRKPHPSSAAVNLTLPLSQHDEPTLPFDQRLSTEEARGLLLKLRAQIAAEFPDIDAQRGLLRKNMMRRILGDRIASEAEFLAKVPAADRTKTDERQFAYLPRIFSVVRRMRTG